MNKPVPNRHVMVFMTFIALLPLVYFIPPWVATHAVSDHAAVTVISVAIIVPLLSYVILPLLSRAVTTLTG